MPKNLIVVFGDEMRGQAMACAGDPNVRTPNMDRMASQGCRFSNAYSNTPVCTPARGTMITGLYPPHHGAMLNDIPIHTDGPSIATELGNAGYRCGWIGKWHLGGVPRSRFIPPGPERLGFDDFWASWNCHHRYFDAKYFLNDNPEPIFVEGYEPTIQVDITLDYLRNHVEQHRDDPFCTFLSWGPPHDPYEPWPPGSEGSYDPAALELRPNCEDTPEHRKDLAGHYAHITALDTELGRVLDFVEENGLRDDTLVVFTGDHGSMLGSQGTYHKQQPWAESVNIPLIMWGPVEFNQSDTDLMFSLLDLPSTMLGLLGKSVPEAMQGVDLAPQIVGRASHADRAVIIAEHRAVIIAEHTCVDQASGMGIPPWRGVKTKTHTYAKSPDGPWLLYDDVADPYQMNNLVADPAAADILSELDAELMRQLDRFGDSVMTMDESLDFYNIRDLWEERTEFLYRDRNMSGDWPGERSE
jgi:arylsulfatase A-like enzyme